MEKEPTLIMAIDRQAFGDAVIFKRNTTGKDLPRGDLAKQLGIITGDIRKAEIGQAISAEAYLILCRWMKIDPYEFIYRKARP